jgi:predicted nucleotidyltransferase
LRELFSLAESSGKLRRAFLWGSYVTAKESPNDLDLLLVMAEDFTLDGLRQDQRVVFDYPQSRIRFHADVFWTKVSIGQEVLNLWLDTYPIDKSMNRRGIVEVIT